MDNSVNVKVNVRSWAGNLNELGTIELNSYDPEHHLNLYVKKNTSSVELCLCLHPDDAKALQATLNKIYSDNSVFSENPRFSIEENCFKNLKYEVFQNNVTTTKETIASFKELYEAENYIVSKFK